MDRRYGVRAHRRPGRGPAPRHVLALPPAPRRRRLPGGFIEAGDTDPRCPPWHARKFGARLQAATGGDAPVFIRIWSDSGHGWATDKEIVLTQQTESLACMLKTLGMVPPERPPVAAK
ncbi:prolyl oligopeptidase family serine peptidase [Streptomyces luomodiensis]|uniref:prolyl oligopeptidase family serine peptidase n=1 Tax=Streptomyces luomodiensis TaxID=3026192 RepID=UPI003D77C88F